MRSRLPALAFGLLIAALVGVALLLDDPVRAFEDPAAATEDGLVERMELGRGGDLRLEAFHLVPRGRRWAAERAVVGSASLLRGQAEGRPQLELDLTWGEDRTRVRRVLRALDGPGLWSYVFREWRAGDEGRVEGRGLVLDREADGALRLREWAGRDQRSDLLLEQGSSAAALTPLGWLEERRGRSGPIVRMTPIFDPIEATLTETLTIELPLAPGLLRGLRVVDLVRLEPDPNTGGARARLAMAPTRYLLLGDDLLGWLEGDLEAVRDPAAELVARR